MKNSKAEDQKKAEKKAAKKELEKSITAKFFEAVKNLGHDAEQIGEDLVLVSKFVAKKIGKKLSSAQKKAGEKVLDAVPEVGQKTASVKKDVKKTESAIKKVTAKTKPVISSVKVEAIATAEKAAKVMEKPSPPVSRKVAKKSNTATGTRKVSTRKPKINPETPNS